MGLFSKLKNVLFEEEEVEIPVIKKEEPKKIEEPSKIEAITKPVTKKEKKESTKIEEKEEDEKKQTVVEEAAKKEIPDELDIEIAPTIERDVFKVDPTFEFPVFDEEDFTSPLKEEKPSKNILKQKKEDKNSAKIDFGKYEITPEEVKEEDKKFKPTPIISPVYGVLNQNYQKEDVVPKKESGTPISRKVADIDSIRKKAYGTLEDEIENMIPPTEELEEVSPSKTIDELLMDSITEEIKINDEEEITEPLPIRERTKEDYEEEVIEKEADKMEKALDMLDEMVDNLENPKKVKEKLENDTLENDLFNLIDSMYDNGKDIDE